MENPPPSNHTTINNHHHHPTAKSSNRTKGMNHNHNPRLRLLDNITKKECGDIVDVSESGGENKSKKGEKRYDIEVKKTVGISLIITRKYSVYHAATSFVDEVWGL